MLGSKALAKRTLGWTPLARSVGVFINLSRAEWIDLGVVAEVVLLAESAVREKIDITIALPLPTKRKSEQRFYESTRDEGIRLQLNKRVSRRERTRSYLSYIEFEVALRLSHLPVNLIRPTILPAYDPSEQGREGDDRNSHTVTDGGAEELYDGVRAGRLKHYTYPLTWVSANDLVQLQRWDEYLARVVGTPKRGLTALDAATLSNVIVYELVDNVARHGGGSGHAIIAATAREGIFPYSPDAWLSTHRDFFEWQHESELPYIDLVIADSGIGIASELSKQYEKVRPHGKSASDAKSSEVVRWAWDRWSTSKPDSGKRGTRGLYRVDRIGRRYAGLVTARTGADLVGFDHGSHGRTTEIDEPERLPFLPGTVLRLTLPAYRSLLRAPLTSTRAPLHTDYRVLTLGPLTEQGFTREAHDRLRSALETPVGARVVVIAIVDGGSKNGLEPALRDAAELRDPAALVVLGLPGSWEEIGLAVNSVNEEFRNEHRGNEAHAPEHFEIWDPVAVISPRGEAHWVAGRREQLVLDALFRADGQRLEAAVLEKVLLSTDDLEVVRNSLRHDSHLVEEDSSGGLTLGFSYQKIMETVRSHVADLIHAHVHRGGTGVLSRAVYRTPALELVNRWIRLSEAIPSSSGFEIVAFLLADAYHATSGKEPPDLLLADPGAPALLVHRLREYLQARKMEWSSGESRRRFPRGVRIISSEQRVAVFVELVDSGETARRALGEVLRDDADAVALLCVLDCRRDPHGPVQIWGKDVLLFSASTVSIHVDVRFKTLSTSIQLPGAPNRVPKLETTRGMILSGAYATWL